MCFVLPQASVGTAFYQELGTRSNLSRYVVEYKNIYRKKQELTKTIHPKARFRFVINESNKID